MPEKKKTPEKIDDKALESVSGGEAPDEIRVKIKTLDGENDDYKIQLHDMDNLVMKADLEIADTEALKSGRDLRCSKCGKVFRSGSLRDEHEKTCKG